MGNSDCNCDSENHNHFYKGLFFGLVAGVGLARFLGSETGKGFIKTARKRIDEALSAEPGVEDYEEEEASEPSTPDVQPESTFSPKPRRLFKRKPK